MMGLIGQTMPYISKYIWKIVICWYISCLCNLDNKRAINVVRTWRIWSRPPYSILKEIHKLRKLILYGPQKNIFSILGLLPR